MDLGACHSRLSIKVCTPPFHQPTNFALISRNYHHTLAAYAMCAMNGVLLGSKQLIVRLHKPKRLHQERLAQRFGGHNGHQEVIVVRQVLRLVRLVIAICWSVEGALMVVLLCLDAALDYQGVYTLSGNAGTHKLTKYPNRHFNIIT